MEASPDIHVGILQDESLSFRLLGSFTLEGSANRCSDWCTVAIENGKITLSNGALNVNRQDGLTLIPGDLNADLFEIPNVKIGINFHWEKRESQRFKGALKLKLSGTKIQLINILPLEIYLSSVISSEMNANSHINLLKAHTIISRSWLLAQIEKQKDLGQDTDYKSFRKSKDELIRWYDREDHRLFHVCADDHCQRYQGYSKITNENVIKAVRDTAGEVLLYENRICDARYSKSCGGVTEEFENCWEEVSHPYLKALADKPDSILEDPARLKNEESAHEFISGRPEAFCNTTEKRILSQVLNDYDQTTEDFFRWRVEYSRQEISDLIREKSGIDFGEISDLIPLERGNSGRLIKLRIVGGRKTLVLGKELEIRRWLSPSHLYSSAFIVSKTGDGDKPDKFILSGAGWGHGVGLCQIGAAVMADRGYDYREILNHYFKGAVITKYYE